MALALPCSEALGQWQNLSELWRLRRIASRTDLTAWQPVNEMASAPPRGRPDTTQRNSSLQREAAERARGRNLRPGHGTCLSPPPMGVLRRTLTRNQVCCHLLKCSSSQGVAPHQTRKPGEGQGGDRESANSHAFPLPTSHSQPGRSSKPIQEKPAEQCTLPVPNQRPENPALSTRTNKQVCGTERCRRVLRRGRLPKRACPGQVCDTGPGTVSTRGRAGSDSAL